MRIELHIERVVLDSAVGHDIDRDAVRAALIAELGRGLSSANLSGVTSTIEASLSSRMSVPSDASAYLLGTALGHNLTGSILSGAHPAPATEASGGGRR
jgi:hypothetical protein